MTEAIILAGGLGTRLRTVVADVPKPMAPVNDRPFLSYLMDYWIKQGVTRFILSVGYKYEIIQNFFGSSYCDIPVEYAIETEPLGTGGGFLKSTKYLKRDQPFLLLNGDTLFCISLSSLYEAHLSYQADLTMALCKANEGGRYGYVQQDSQHHIISMNARKAIIGEPSNGGVYLISPELLQELPSFSPPLSLEEKLLPELLTKNIRCFANLHQAPFLDIGVPKDYLKLQHFVEDFDL